MLHNCGVECPITLLKELLIQQNYKAKQQLHALLTLHTIFNAVVTVDFGSPTYTVPENGDTVTVCLTTSSGSIEPIRVDVSTAPRTAERKLQLHILLLLTYSYRARMSLSN